MRKLLPLVLLVALVPFIPRAAHAHAIDTGGLRLHVEEGKVTEDLVLAPGSLSQLVPLDADGDGQLSAADIRTQSPFIFAQTFGVAPLTADGADCHLTLDSVAPEGMSLRVRATGQCDASARKLRQKLGFLSSLSEGHRIVVEASIDGETHEDLADRATQVLVFEHAAQKGFLQFVGLGIEHIFTGYDHLLFLLGLLLGGGSLKRLLGVVSAFTVAHSITLGLAALNVVMLPSRLVESAIAASIVYVALENFFVKEPKNRWIVAFLFGLVHGFGFASALAEMHLTRHGVLAALFGFNFGVEIGQASLVLVFAPLIALGRRREPFLRYGIPGLSLLSVSAGAYWFVQRAFMG